MKIKYLEDTDSALVEFAAIPVAETRGLPGHICFDAAGRVVSLTLEHANARGSMSGLIFQRLPERRPARLGVK